ncbi:hypothetical protein F4821DRAFT_211031 [Hypoxylon rubiginosum]|uniref:Uncharacterized protein n=1 Tax=Hypoxylon rubiginosum TaxID=110542 RepID=A0ACC0DEA9_9PEZI|nr:hypothetical protein F4821DRAFT_211031 [Hypoxylon rubiginosum]
MRISTLKAKEIGQRLQDLYRFALLPWGWELLSWFCALGLLTAIFTIISRANGKPQEDWSFPITLNSLTATLSTIYRAVLVAIAAQIISQDKWIWFWKPSSPIRPLKHLQLFEDASRGMWGALTLMPVVARHSPSSLIATIIIIVSLATGPFVQQSIKTEFRESPLELGTASLPVAHLVNDPSSWFRTQFQPAVIWWDLEATTRGSLFSTLTNPHSNDSTILSSCITGNCTFPSWGLAQPEGRGTTHSSLGVCSSCVDVGSLVTQKNASTNATSQEDTYPTFYLPNEMKLARGYGGTWMAVGTGDLGWASKLMTPEAGVFPRWSFANVTVFTIAGDPDDNRYAAATCSLYPCLQSYVASVRDGRLSESLVDSTPLYPDLGQYNDTTGLETLIHKLYQMPYSDIPLAAIQSPCRVNDTIYTTSNMSKVVDGTNVRIYSPEHAPDYPSITAPKECVYRFHSFLFMLMQAVIQKNMDGSCTWDGQMGISFIECSDQWWLAPFWEQRQASVGTITDRFSAIAGAMTNQLRLGFGTRPEDKAQVLGTAIQTLPCTAIQWQWLLLPTVLLILETIVLFRMISRSWRFREEEMVWKSNILPLLYYPDRFAGTDGQSINYATHQTDASPMRRPFRTASEMEKSAAHIQVELRRGRRQGEDNITLRDLLP